MAFPLNSQQSQTGDPTERQPANTLTWERLALIGKSAVDLLRCSGGRHHLSSLGVSMSRLATDDLLNLSVSERIQLVEDIWDSIAMAPESLQLSDEQRTELDRRLEAYHNDPAQGMPWDTVRARIRNRK
jgi:putative addiction module component (TIGR02574 family)